MECEFSYDPKGRFMVVRASGVMGISDLRDAAVKVVEYARQHSCDRALADLRQCRPTISITELFGYRTGFLSDGLRRLYRALLVKEQSLAFRFFESVSANRGQSVRVFTDESQARAWLAPSHPTRHEAPASASHPAT